MEPPIFDLINSLAPHVGCVIEPTSDGLQLTGASRNFMNAAAVSTRAFRAPWHELIWDIQVTSMTVLDGQSGSLSTGTTRALSAPWRLVHASGAR